MTSKKELPVVLVHKRSSTHRLITPVLLFSLLVASASGFTPPQWKSVHAKHHSRRRVGDFVRAAAAQKEPTLDLQSDDTLYGRGEMHLSAVLKDDDVVVYRTGTWTVDGVEVGDGSPACYRYARVENVQLVWTHNCEHGVIRGVALRAIFSQGSTYPHFNLVAEEQVEFGPEQLIARIPIEWNDGFDEGTSLIDFDESIWQ